MFIRFFKDSFNPCRFVFIAHSLPFVVGRIPLFKYTSSIVNRQQPRYNLHPMSEVVLITGEPPDACQASRP